MDLSLFKELPEYPEYLVSPSGEFYSTKVNRLLNIHINTGGYPFVQVFVEGSSKFLLLHRVLARVFKNLPSLDSDLEVDHDNGDILDFSLENLIVRSRQEHLEKTIQQRGHISHTKNNKCIDCATEIESRATRCNKCNQQLNVKRPEVTAEIIEYWVKNYSWVRAAKELGYSDNGLRKRYRALSGKDPKSIKGC